MGNIDFKKGAIFHDIMISESTIKLVLKKNLTEDVILFSFSVPKDFTFEAGQYIMLKMINGIDSKWRAYSICSPPSQVEQIDLCVKIVVGGFASELFKKVEVGQEFLMKSVFGHFIFEQAEESWFICAGTGIAPMYSMIKEHLLKLPHMKFVLLASFRCKTNLLFHDEFNELTKYDNFEYYPTLTREKWEGRTGRVQEHLPEDCSGKTFYLCGLKELVLETKEVLLSKGVAKEKIKFERYS
jgi:ferredoxin-NADP reductase